MTHRHPTRRILGSSVSQEGAIHEDRPRPGARGVCRLRGPVRPEEPAHLAQGRAHLPGREPLRPHRQKRGPLARGRRPRLALWSPPRRGPLRAGAALGHLPRRGLDQPRASRRPRALLRAQDARPPGPELPAAPHPRLPGRRERGRAHPHRHRRPQRPCHPEGARRAHARLRQHRTRRRQGRHPAHGRDRHARDHPGLLG